MYVIDVIPLIYIPRNLPQILSYFNDEPIGIGVFVEVLINKRKIIGVAISCDLLKNRKLDFKKSVDFKLKKISKILFPEVFVSRNQLRIANWLASYYFSPLGVCLKTVLSLYYSNRTYKIKNNFEIFKKNTDSPIHAYPRDYGKLIDYQIKNGRQVLLLVPEMTTAKYYHDVFKIYKPEIISSGLKSGEIIELSESIFSGHIKLIIGTRISLFLSFKYLGLIIADDESNDAYKSDMSPRYHAVDLARFVASTYGAKFVIGGVLPRLEMINDSYRANTKRLVTSIMPINMVSEIKAGNFSIFSRDLKEYFNSVAKGNEKMIIFAPRRGHSNFLLCKQCGSAIHCPNCSTSLVIHNNPEKSDTPRNTVLKCHHCNYTCELPKQCPICEGYQLKPHGIGVEKIYDEVKKYYLKNNVSSPTILRFDSDIVKNEYDEENIINQFTSTSKIILVTTAMIFSYKNRLLNDSHGLIFRPIIGIITMDSLINFPDFRGEESLFRRLLILRDMSKILLVQTYNQDYLILNYLSLNHVSEFISSEMKNRRRFNYPPYSKLIKISFRHSNSEFAKRESTIVVEKLKQLSGQYKYNAEIIGPFPAFVFKERGLYDWLIAIKDRNVLDLPLEPGDTNLKLRNDFLRVIPSSRGWSVDIDPKSII